MKMTKMVERISVNYEHDEGTRDTSTKTTDIKTKTMKKQKQCQFEAGTDSTTERKQNSIREKTRNQSPPNQKPTRQHEPPKVKYHHRKSEESNTEKGSCQEEELRGRLEGRRRRRRLESCEMKPGDYFKIQSAACKVLAIISQSLEGMEASAYLEGDRRAVLSDVTPGEGEVSIVGLRVRVDELRAVVVTNQFDKFGEI